MIRVQSMEQIWTTEGRPQSSEYQDDMSNRASSPTIYNIDKVNNYLAFSCPLLV